MRFERWFYIVPLRVRSLFRRTRVEQELDDELRDHVERLVEANIARGATPEEARYAALRAMDGVEQRKEQCRDARHVRIVEDLARDLRYATRMLRRSPGFTAVVIASLALGIGANTAIFSAIDAVMLRRLAVKDPRELVLLHWSSKERPAALVRHVQGGRFTPGASVNVFSSFVFEQLRDRAHVFSQTFATAGNGEAANVSVDGRAASAGMQGVSGNYFEGVGVSAFIGRTILPADDREAAPAVAVASYEYWQRTFGGDPAVVGRSIAISGTSVTIIGVMPPEFFGIEPGRSPDFWIPLSLYSSQEARSGNSNHGVPLQKDPTTWWLHVVGRLKPGVTRAEARSELSRIVDQSIASSGTTLPQDQMPRVNEVLPIERGLDFLRTTYSTSLFLLMAMVGLVLLMACGNVAGLMLARATARRGEIAVRLSLGASRVRLIRQLVTESVLLAVLGGAAGLLVSGWITSALPHLLSIKLALKLDARVLAFAAVVSTLSGVLFGLAPACRATRVEPLPALKHGRSQDGAPTRAAASGMWLSAGQVALCLLLLIGAGLFIRTLQKLQAVDVGFDGPHLLFFQTRPGLNGYKDPRLTGYYEDLQRRIASLPGVRAASFSDRQPIGSGTSNSGGAILGAAAPHDSITVRTHRVGSDYFATLGIPIVRGRAIGAQDQQTSPHVLVINERLAREHFSRHDPLGQRIDLGSGAPFEIVGVAKDVKDNRLRDATVPTVYLPYRQFMATPASMTFEVRGAGDLSALIDVIRREASSLDFSVPLVGMKRQTEILDETLALERTFATLSTSFGLLALVLACVGLYGTMAFSVARRTHEIGVRMALGAARGLILRMVMRQSLHVVAGGLAVGLPLALLGAQVVKSQLFGLAPHDPLTILLASLVVVAVTTLAGAVPAWRASRLNPLAALRCE